MAKFRYGAAAKNDLDSIATYVADRSGSRAVAERFARELRAKCRDLAAAPIQMGRSRAELGAGLRSPSHKNYVIFFRYVGGVLEIINILEGHRDIDAFFHGGQR